MSFRILMLSVLALAAPRLSTHAQQYAAAPGVDRESYDESYRKYERDDNALSPRPEPKYVSHGDYRQPISLVILDSTRALIATKLTGEIYELNLLDHSLRVVFAAPGRQFQRLITLGEGRLAVTDTARDEVIVLRFDDASDRWSESAVAKVAGRPNALSYEPQKSELWVSSVWGQRLHRFAVDENTETGLQPIDVIDLPMCGGPVLCLPKFDAVLVSDAFGSHFAVVRQSDGKVINHDRLYEHNLGDLASIDDGDSVLLTHQLLIDLVPAVQGQITWGNFISNNLRRIKTERLINASGDYVYVDSQIVSLGRVGNGAGDPTSVATNRLGIHATTIGGTNQVAMGSISGGPLRFVDTGLHPVDCEFTPDAKSLVVVNQFSDSVTLIEMETLQATHIALGDIRPPTTIERGEQLFHDSSLSHDGWMSCQSCHVGGHSNGLLTDNFTDHSYQSPKRVLSLLGQAGTAPYSWAGTVKTLEDQIRFSIKSTMASDDSVFENEVEQIAQYVRSLQRPPSLLAARSGDEGNVHLDDRVKRGADFFRSSGCVDCHREPHFTSDGVYDVGLHDESSMREFNPPSLEAVSQRQNALFHDASARSLRDVVYRMGHQMPAEATDQQRDDLIQYLMSL